MFDILFKPDMFSIKCQALFADKLTKKKNHTHLSPGNFAGSMLKVKKKKKNCP